MLEVVALENSGDKTAGHGEMMEGQRAPRSNDFLQIGRPKK